LAINQVLLGEIFEGAVANLVGSDVKIIDTKFLLMLYKSDQNYDFGFLTAYFYVELLFKEVEEGHKPQGSIKPLYKVYPKYLEIWKF
jgi:hypothetical protein